MISYSDALSKVLAVARPMASERVATADAAGRVLAETLRAPEPMPAFDYSAMDGYAVCRADFDGPGPWTVPVRGESKTGAPAPALARGSACRIFTGAPVPAGADAVVMQENVGRDGDTARFESAPAVGQHIRRAGEDLEKGSVAIEAGTRLGPLQVGLVAALDRAHVLVARRPQVTIICTGDELRAPGDPPFEGSIPESNGISLAAMARQVGGDAHIAALSRDDTEATRSAIAGALESSDVVVTIGGVSVGDYDVVRPALEAAGAALDFWKVRIKPGKPLALGTAGRTVVLGVPGNPSSAQVTFALFGAPLLRAMQGDRRASPKWGRAKLAGTIQQKAGRTGFYRATLDGDVATVLTNQASGSATSMAWADALVVVPESSTGVEAGEMVEIVRLAEL